MHHTQTAQARRTYPPVTYIRVPHPPGGSPGLADAQQRYDDVIATSRSDQHGHARGAGATRAEQITMWEAWFQANRAAVHKLGH